MLLCGLRAAFGGTQGNQGSPPPTRFGRGRGESVHQGMFFQESEGPFFQDTFTFAVDDPDGQDPGPDTFPEIVVQQVRHFGGTKQMQVDHIFYGDDDRFHVLVYSTGYAQKEDS